MTQVLNNGVPSSADSATPSSADDQNPNLQGFTQDTLMQGLNNPTPPQQQQPSAGVQAVRKHGGLLTGLVGVLLDGLSAGVRTPQGPNGFSQSAQMAAQMPMQRQQQAQQQMNFQTQQELAKAQIAQAHVQQLQTHLMLIKANDDLASGMSMSQLKFAEAATEDGRAKQIATGSLEAAQDKAKQLRDQNSDSALHIWIYPTHHDANDMPDEFGVYESYPGKTYQKDFKTTLLGNQDRGGKIPDKPILIKAGTDNDEGHTYFQNEERNQTALVTHDDDRMTKETIQSMKADPTQVIQGQVGGQTQNILLNKRTKQQTVLGPAAPKAAATTPADINTQAQMLVEGNLDPSQVTKRGGTQGAILSAANAYSQQKYNKPYDPAQQQEDYKFATNTQTQNTLKYLNSLTGNDNKSGNLGDLLKISDSITRTDFPALNNAAAWARLQSGDPGIVQFKTTVTEVADQVAKILQGGGGGTSDAKLHQAQEMFNAGFSKDQLKAVASSLRDLLANRKRELIGDNVYLKKQYGRQAATADRDAAATASQGRAVRVNGKVVGYTTDGKTMTPVAQ